MLIKSTMPEKEAQMENRKQFELNESLAESVVANGFKKPTDV